MAALLPCTWSYADIAVSLRDRIAEHPVYAGWVGFFADPAYVELIAGRRATLDRLAAGIPRAPPPQALRGVHDEHPAGAPVLGHVLRSRPVA